MEIRNLGDAAAAVTPQPTPADEVAATATSTVTGPMLKLGEINALLSQQKMQSKLNACMKSGIKTSVIKVNHNHQHHF